MMQPVPNELPMTTEEVVARLKAMLPDLLARYPLVKLALVGSYAEGLQRADSDIDIGIEATSEMGLRFFDLQEELEKEFRISVDIIFLNALRPHWQEYIAKTMIVLYERERQATA